MFLEGFAEIGASLDATLSAHLRGNLFPPVPLSMLGACKRAIENANRGLWDKKVRLPEGVTWHGKKLAPTSNIIASHHLEFFLENEDNEDWE
jgi:hypothetical protein